MIYIKTDALLRESATLFFRGTNRIDGLNMYEFNGTIEEYEYLSCDMVRSDAIFETVKELNIYTGSVDHESLTLEKLTNPNL